MSTKPSIFKRIFLLCWNVINGLRKLFLNLVFFGLIAIIIVSLASEDTVQVEDGSALVLSLSGVIVDQKRQVDPFEAAMKSGNEADGSGEILLADVLTVINNAAHDERISQIVLDLALLNGTGMSKLQSIGDALNAFKATGKTVVANGDWYGQNQYFLASFADKIYLNPQGSVQIEGLSRYRLYFKSAFEKLKINAHVFRVGTFKSAVEPFIRDDMSAAAKEANLTLLNDLWQSYADTVAANRGLKTDDLSLSGEQYLAQLDKADGQSAQMALNMNWVDALKSAEEFRLAMVDSVGKSTDGESFKHIDFYDYLSVTQSHPVLSLNDKVGIIVAKGNIMNGSQPAGQIGGESTSNLLRKARFDDSVKAVVLRVDSPGGSAFASEQIRQEVLALKEANKPVVVSMGSYAASGGYWISASADYIYATPTTLTGSIGIFGMITTFEDSLASIGVHTDGVGTSDWAGFSVTKGLSPQIKAVIQRHIERGYHDFISLVANERNMSLEQVDSIAQGRVWTGRKALELGLVDGLGELQDAVTKAAEMASLDHYDTDVIERELTPQEQFVQEMFAASADYLPPSLTQSSALDNIIGQWSSVVNEFKSFDDPNGVYLYCDTCNY
ncbi:signal peptide peptidase SppA [Shewanella fidelis]|uniref:Signal peptide peptidase SppA n=1 Tax=Shewanella fidelis TaxID=173509 RepID=A0AAW8NM38_9GAMM|nr:signal peptide peptidase SppA [Shewanella fidelis]MDR8523752.1 signal peptide peptidase SppA [Shewanella fidelis]MDW4810300.1 signal peptide peptidase SppA [Shewanella fidelis]MDW4814445.1 signal peptide peptidase SppA [Shewanella fidelis]MDW4818535.1 signal peptide peptidase SppA [Shewanella fidelis]MDW4823812.1 signal peptide peptidase SppA [Shewanella fidelis]